MNTVDAQISAAHTQARIFRAGRSFASLLWLNASAMQAELWQWMDGHTLTEVQRVARHHREAVFDELPVFGEGRALEDAVAAVAFVVEERKIGRAHV